MSWHIGAAGRGQALLEELERQAATAHVHSGEPARTVITAHVASVKAIVAAQPERALDVISTGHIDSHSVMARCEVKGLNLVESKTQADGGE